MSRFASRRSKEFHSRHEANVCWTRLPASPAGLYGGAMYAHYFFWVRNLSVSRCVVPMLDAAGCVLRVFHTHSLLLHLAYLHVVSGFGVLSSRVVMTDMATKVDADAQKASRPIIIPATAPLPFIEDGISVVSFNVLLPNSNDGWWIYKVRETMEVVTEQLCGLFRPGEENTSAYVGHVRCWLLTYGDTAAAVRARRTHSLQLLPITGWSFWSLSTGSYYVRYRAALHR